ncbi:MAG: putative O-glycosylation ligase, exosortase A system-associated [Colwellia sp.]|nr:putative O-glycosylation ligase, exosortase A system-associated [Colwellia sp.]
MRDIVLILIIPFIIYAVLNRPFIGAAMWLWVAMHFPNGWVYGFAGSLRYNLIIVICAFLSYLRWKDKGKLKVDQLTFLIISFLIWTFLTSLFTISIPEIVWSEWIEFLKITLLYVFAILVLRTQLHINVLIWALALSVGFYGCLEGLKYIASGGAHRIAGLGSHVLSDRNELALAFNMMLPLLVYLIGISKQKWMKVALFCAIALNIVAIVGTYSRGGFVALIIVGGYFWLQSKRKVLYSVLIIIALFIGSNYAPSSWTNRMDTLETAKTDSSFLGRVLAWKHAVLVANDNIITGGGFRAGQTGYVWWSYDAAGSFNDVIDTSSLKAVGFKAAHSIYFQVLGDHGYIGLFLFLAIIFTAYRNAGRVARLAKKTHQDESIIRLCSLIRVSLIAFCAGGAGVSLAYFDMFYAIIAVIYVVEYKIINRSETHILSNTNRRAVHV